MRKRIFEIIEMSSGKDVASSIYDYFMIIVILASLVPLAFKQEHIGFEIIEKISVAVFITDYLLRLITADYKYQTKSVASFVKYPFSFMAIIDLLSILPSITILNNSFKLLRILRLIRAFRVFRVFKVLRYSKSFKIIAAVFKKQRDSLYAVITLAIAYILISALIIFNVEPDSFTSFFDAIYWATISLTTMGYVPEKLSFELGNALMYGVVEFADFRAQCSANRLIFSAMLTLSITFLLLNEVSYL